MQVLPSIDLLAEAQLDEQIQYSQDVQTLNTSATAVLLTGATGFLGAYLLHDLLRMTHVTVYCLVRCADNATGLQRLQAHLQTLDLAIDWQRVVIVKGDLALPLFGLSAEDYQQLADKIQLIYHNGAQVNALRPYSALKPTNVLGTQTILQFASLLRVKPVQFVSTVAVFFSPAHRGQLLETTEPDGQQLQGGYRQSKWVAERLVQQAQARGLPTVIYRAGRLVGHSQTGAHGNLNDLFCLVLKACLLLGSYPNVDTYLNLTPIDYVSQGLVQLSQQNTSIGQTFHILNPNNISWLEMMGLLADLGYCLKPLTYADWLQAVAEEAAQSPKESIFNLLRFLLRNSAFFTDTPLFNVTQTTAQLAPLGLTCPPINAERMRIYLHYLQKIGFIPALVS
ncbi:thioester reductase-like protein [Beggiatoa alba B18LD]|uniref:Thioester reductase-like protein n=1 Tax=Beggiatoa alba B18LD TaxID=395493 RepID=I3CDY1_9GAMM|nr:thioester reductase domain-containing protein [Beggiatoa alba]EIJ41824.1 thioester reductase-like protein [Beggiatoa alba B18LD]